MNFAGKVVLVTGASRGIGLAIAHQFAERGAKVALHYRSDKLRAEQALAALPGTGHAGFCADLGKPTNREKLIADVKQQFQAVDILVNNAGIYLDHPLPESALEQWRDAWQQILTTNLTAPAELCYLAAKVMIKQGGGRIINISSRGAFRGEPSAPAYGASKAGLNALSQSLAVALAPHNIFVSVVAPGFIATDMATPFLEGPEGQAIRAQSPLGRVGTAEEVAHAVVFLASQGAEFTTGAVLDVNGASYLR